ncbi:MAG: YfiR family protein [Marinilabiliaceae bacterium]|nr:YfiR family protein [Marinilabiliaceae bacterium]
MAEAQMSKFQALYVYNFAKNIGWPPEDANRDLNICVIGDNDLVAELTTLAKTKKVGARSVVINSAASVNGIPKSDIIIVGESKTSQISQLITNQTGNKTLIVSGKKGMCSMGAGISFVSDNGKLNFEISNKNIKNFGLSVSQKLLSLGTELD